MRERIREIRADQKLTQARFAESIGLTQNYIAQVEMGAKRVSDRTVRDICRIYGVNELWLRTGNGEKYAPKSREQEMAELVKSLMADNPESFRSRLVTALLRFDPNGPEWEVLERIYESIAAEAEKAGE